MGCYDDDDEIVNVGPRDCFWYRQGKCFLFSMSEKWVFDILASTPEARTDLLSCARQHHCPMTEPEFVDFAKKDITIREAQESSDKFQKMANRYIDRHRQIQKGTVFREADPKDDGDDDGSSN